MAKTINLDFDAMGKAELRAACKDAGIAGYNKLTNDGMRAALREAYAEPAQQEIA